MHSNRLIFYPDYYRESRNSIYLLDGFSDVFNDFQKICLPSRHGRWANYRWIKPVEFLFLAFVALDCAIGFFWPRRRLLSFYFKRRKVDQIVVICSYNRYTTHLLRQAKIAGVRTIELQHGHTTKSHAAYSKGFDFLDEFWCWSDGYKEVIRSFDKDLRVACIGMPFRRQSANQRPDQIKSLLVIDQWSIRDDLVVMTKSLAQRYPNLKISYKLHPNRAYWPKNPLFDSDKGIKVLRTSTRVIDIATQYDAFVGEYSTGLIEAAVMDRRVFFTPGYSDDLLSEGGLVKLFEELIGQLDCTQ